MDSFSDTSRKDILNEMEKINNTLSIQNKKNVAILWDVENVTPSSKSLFIDGLLEYANKFGRVNISKAFADWTNKALSTQIPALSDNSFELIHVYVRKKGKNASDMEMIAQGIELAIQKKYLDTFILVTGDIDFTPLIHALRRSGKEVHIVCDNMTVSNKLLVLVDSFIDFRELVPGADETEIEKIEIKADKKPKQKDKQSNKEKIERNLELLSEAALLLDKEKKKGTLSLLKVRIQLLNPLFKEKELGFSQWSKFVEHAVEMGHLESKGDLFIAKSRKKSKLVREGEDLITVLKKLDGKKHQYHLFSKVSNTLKENGINYRDLGYKQFKKFILTHQNRGIVEVAVNGLAHSVRIRQ